MITIEKIHNNSDFVITNAGFTKPNEFVDFDGATIKKGVPYHIHYTNDKQEWYMTGGVHSNESKIIIRIKGRSRYANYAVSREFDLSKDNYIKATSPIPQNDDYNKGFIDRYFARQANDENASILEINVDDYELPTPFYKKVRVKWTLIGKESDVIKENNKVINNAALVFPKLSKLLNPIQFWKPSIMTIEDIRSSLR